MTSTRAIRLLSLILSACLLVGVIGSVLLIVYRDWLSRFPTDAF